ncbi:tetratricopeptide repeat protein [Spirillospora sp. CA-255316]
MVLRRDRRRVHGWWLLMAAAAIGAVASLAAASLPALAGSALVAVAGGFAGVLAVRAERSIERNAPVKPSRELQGRPPRVRDLDDPLAVGVHPALSQTTEAGTVDRCPPFVRRDRSGDVEAALRRGGFVLVVGESTAGKTRAAYEAMRACLPDHVFVRPRSREDLPEALRSAARHRRSVVWLDDLELYLGPNGLTAGMIGSLPATPRRRTVVLATMRSHERARYSPRFAQAAETHDRHAMRLAGEVLNLAHEVRIERLWSDRERDRAAGGVDDRRIARALEQADRFGVAQYLAAGPQLFQEWRDAWGSWPEGRPRGAALVAAAVDVRRAGYHQPLPIAFLRTMHEAYLAEPGRSYLRLESWEEALAWATEPLHATSSLLMPAGDDHYVAFDYLADAVDDTGPAPEVPDHAWEAVTAFVPAADAVEVGWAAFLRHRPDLAERALLRSLADGHYDAALDFAAIMRETDREEDVIAALGRAVRAAASAGAPPEKIIELRAAIAWWIGNRYENRGDARTAHDLAREVVADATILLGADHPRTLSSRITLIRQIGDLGRPEEALAMAGEVAETALRVHGADHWIYSSARFEVAVWTHFAGDSRGAVRLWQELVDDTLTPGPKAVEDSLRNITGVLARIGDPAFHAELAGWLEALAARARDEGRLDDRNAVTLLRTLASWVGELGDPARARDIAQAVLDEGAATLGPDDAGVLEARLVLARQEGELGNIAEARALSRDTAEAASRIYGDLHRLTIWAREEQARWAAPDRPSQPPDGPPDLAGQPW